MKSYNKLCTEFYDADKLTADIDSEEVSFYKQKLATTDLILEPMCGSGRLLIPLLQLGYNVEGLDTSEPMLYNCQQRANNPGSTGF